MEERNYQVQEAVRLIGVESHVLRYWEEELGITVGRTKQGYRLYSEENIRLFRQVKELKAQGIGLKALRLLLGGADEGMTGRERLMASLTQTGAAEPVKEDQTDRMQEEITDACSTEKKWKCTKKEDARHDEKKSEKNVDEEARQEQESQEAAEEHLQYEVITNESGTMAEFEKILRRIIREAVADQNERLELAMTERIREELELQLDAILDALGEAAAQQEEAKGGLWKRIWKRFGSKKGHPL